MGSSQENCAPAYTVRRVGSPPDIDGVLTEYASAEALCLSTIKGGNTFEVRLLWNDDALYLSYLVTDTDLLAEVTKRDGDVWLDDSVEWFIDILGNDGGGRDPKANYMLPDDFQGIVNVSNIQLDSRGTDEAEVDIIWDGDWQSAVEIIGTLNDSSDVDTQYTVEMRIPWTTMELTHPPDFDSCMRMSFAENDRDNDSLNAIMWPDHTTNFRNASKWQDVMLSGK